MGTADKTYYLDENGKVTTDEEKAATVLINKGQDIPKEMVERYGIGKSKAKAEDADTEDTADTETSAPTKKASTSKANKAAKPASNK